MKAEFTPQGQPRLRVHWNREATKIKCLAIEEFNEIVDTLVSKYSNGWVNIENGFNTGSRTNGRATRKTDILSWEPASGDDEASVLWTQDNKNSIYVVYLADTLEECRLWWITMTPNMMNGQEMTGGEAIKELDTKIKEDTSKSLNQWLGGIEGSDLGTNDVSKLDYEDLGENEKLMVDFKRMMPPRLQWIDSELVGLELDNYQKADFSSAYPSNAFHLPTWHGHKEIVVDEFDWDLFREFREFEYAFCLDSRKIYIKSEEFCSADVLESTIWDFIGKRDSVRPPQYTKDRVILCKDCGLDLEKYWTSFYDKRKNSSSAKTVMVASIGTFESCQYRYAQHFQGYCALVIYWRHIAKMAKLFDTLVERDQVPIQFAIDSIGWLGEPQPDLVGEKKLGNLCQEYADSRVCLKANGVYAVESNGAIYVKAQGTHLPDNVRVRKLIDVMSIKSCGLRKQKHINPNVLEYYRFERVAVERNGNRTLADDIELVG